MIPERIIFVGRGITVRVLIILCNGSVYFREGLIMIPSESKHVAKVNEDISKASRV